MEFNQQHLERWISDETRDLAESDFLHFREDVRIGVAPVLAACRKWAEAEVPFEYPASDSSRSLGERPKRIFAGLRAHSRAFLRETHGCDIPETTGAQEWVRVTYEQLFAALVSDFRPPRHGGRITRKQLDSIVCGSGFKWQANASLSDEGAWVYSRAPDSHERFTLSFVLAGRGSQLGYRLGYQRPDLSEVPVTYDRLVGLPGFLLQRESQELVQPGIVSILRESENVIQAIG